MKHYVIDLDDLLSEPDYMTAVSHYSGASKGRKKPMKKSELNALLQERTA